MHFRYFAVALLLFLTGTLQADQPEKKTNGKAASSYTASETFFNINNISTIFSIDGRSDYDTVAKSAAFAYPKGDPAKTVFFQSGLLWGAKILDNPGEQPFRVGGSAYWQGLVGGRIMADGNPQNTDDPAVRVYRVRPDALNANADFSSEMELEEKTHEEVYETYAKDWNEWPAELGAPYEDKDGSGSYDPNVDVPGVEGADQTIWFVSNDLDTSKTKAMYGSLPIGLEVQTTIWGYNDAVPLGNTLFRKYTLINKGGKFNGLTYSSDLDSMYVCMWSDPDLGDATDDFVGCDTTLNLGYVYNSTAHDYVYHAGAPAAGFDLLQGPVVSGEATDKAMYKGRYVKGKKNLPMTAFFLSCKPERAIL